ncbi:MAG: hypothetical protein V7709_18265 [Halioglobus sp.]
MRPLWLLLFAALLPVSANVRAEVPTVTVRGLSVNFSPFTVAATPGEHVSLEVAHDYSAVLNNTPQRNPSPGHWLIKAPTAPGLYSLIVSNGADSTMEINFFVTTPASKVQRGLLNGYRIGPPPPGHKTYPELYRAPAGFIEVTEELLDVSLSPHITLRQILCKQASDYPKYVVIKESLLVLLEGLLETIQQRGYPAVTFGVISTYRTPWYNKTIGNVPNSRHVYGDAMDLFIDLDSDGKMDDLNRDGVHNRDDVDLLANLAEEFMSRPENRSVYGGVGRYGKTHRHGGFVHVDTRGYAARW